MTPFEKWYVSADAQVNTTEELVQLRKAWDGALELAAQVARDKATAIEQTNPRISGEREMKSAALSCARSIETAINNLKTGKDGEAK